MFENEHAKASRIIADIEWRRTSPPDDEDPDEFEEPDDDCGYELSDPKHPKFYERMAGAADHARKSAKEG